MRTRFLLLAFAGLPLSMGAQNDETAEPTYPIAEYDRAATIVMHEPNEELFVGTMHPAAVLFMDYFNADKAAEEHEAYQDILRKTGANVVTVRDLLLKGCVDEEGNAVEGAELDALREFASHYLTYTCSEGVDPAEQETYRQEMLAKFQPGDLVDIILLQPEIILRKTDINTSFEASYQLHPVMNLFFMRDQAITTSKGVVIGKMNSSQRRTESDIAEFCYRKLGERPIYRIEGEDAFLEGGDYLPFGTLSFIGCGLRTTQAAIDQLLEHDLIGKDTLVVVRDQWKSQDQMHLDTYFNIIDRDLVTMCANRVEAQPDDIDFLTADIYAKNTEGSFEKVASGVPFTEFLTKRGIDIIPIEKADELNYANNFLTVGARKIVMVAGQSLELQTQLREHGVDVTWAYLDNLTHGYGAAHCMTQVVRRVPQDETGSSVKTLTAGCASCQVEGGKGIIRLTPDRPMKIDIYDVQGENIASQRIANITSLTAAPGIYIVATENNNKGVKVVVE